MEEYKFGMIERVSAAIILWIVWTFSLISFEYILQHEGTIPPELEMGLNILMVMMFVLIFCLCFSRPATHHLKIAYKGTKERVLS